MPLNEHEQEILDEIERRFYEEDPGFASAVRSINPRARFALSPRLAVVFLVLGVALLAAAFARTAVGLAVAVVGFGLMVWSATTLVQELRSRPREPRPQRAPNDD